ncbi:hypothetical protein [Tamlana flava]|uniref:hypothetical protein n=1 Tax=Tamlana flava TaxID=3158572 RepID=UPI00351B10D5
MKTLKSYFPLFIAALLLSSCIVKSMYPFYTKDVLYFEPKFIGNWIDEDDGIWKVKPFHEFYKQVDAQLKEEKVKMYSQYNNISYHVHYEKDSVKFAFLVVPFKVQNQIFLDFLPIESNKSFKDMEFLYSSHLIGSHTLAKLFMDSQNNMSIKWLGWDKLGTILKDHKANIKHEKIGMDEFPVLTASSEKLVRSIKKYINSEMKDKGGTDLLLELKRS